MVQQEKKLLGYAVLVYLLWVVGIYVLEGRIDLLLRSLPAQRMLYVLIVYVLIGTILPLRLLQQSITAQLMPPAELGFQPLKRTLMGVGLAFLVGVILFILAVPFGLFFVSPPYQADITVLVNIFFQALPISIAEVLICFALFGKITEMLLRHRYSLPTALFGGILTGALLFSLSHLAHGPPFNSAGVLISALLPGFSIGFVYFLRKDIYAAIVLMTFINMIGFIRLYNPYVFKDTTPLHASLAVVAVIVLIAADYLWIRRHPAGSQELAMKST